MFYLIIKSPNLYVLSYYFYYLLAMSFIFCSGFSCNKWASYKRNDLKEKNPFFPSSQYSINIEAI